MPKAPLHPRLAPVAWLVGVWAGYGRGLWPAEPPFEFSDHQVFEHDGRPVLADRQQTRGPAGTGSHAEAGYLTPAGDAVFHWTIASPTGVTEVLVGTVEGHELDVSSTETGHTPTAAQVTATRRRLSLKRENVLRVELALALDARAVAPHTESVLHRVQ